MNTFGCESLKVESIRKSQSESMIKNTCLALAFSFCFAVSIPAADSSDLDKMQGKWETKKTTDEGDKITVRLEINKDKLVFKILDLSGDVKFYGVAKLKADKIGLFNVLKVSDIKGGDSEKDMSPIEDHITIYQLRNGKMILASNFEKERDEAPALDVYERVSK